MHCKPQDALVYMWDLETGSLISKLAGHEGTVYMAKWNQSQALLARYVLLRCGYLFRGSAVLMLLSQLLARRHCRRVVV